MEEDTVITIAPSIIRTGITAASLYEKSDFRAVQNVIEEQIMVIDSAIELAHSKGFNGITHELPMTLCINNLNKADSQIFVYSELLRLYREEKGFKLTTIEMGQKNLLHIKWLNGLSQEERNQRREFIHSCLVRPTVPPRAGTNRKLPSRK